MKKENEPLLRDSAECSAASIRLSLVVLSIGAASHFLLYLDSVVDNLLPAAMPFLMKVYKNEKDAELGWELIVSSRIYGLACGCLASIVLSNNSGRKYSVLLGIVLDIVGVLFTLTTIWVPMGIAAAIIGRFINGIGQGIVQTTGAVMLAEIPPLRRRGTALATLTMWACIGELLGMLISLEDVLGRNSTWTIAMGVPLIFLIPSLCILWTAPESPRYLYMTGRDIECRKSLVYYQNAEDVLQSFNEIQGEMKFLMNKRLDVNGNAPNQSKHLSKTFVWKSHMSRFKDMQFMQPLVIAIFVQSFVHLDDWIWISYSTPIFENNGLSSAAAQRSSLLMAIPQAAISILLLKIFDDYSRRSLIMIPTLFSVAAGVLSIWVSGVQRSYNNHWALKYSLPLLAAADLAAAAVSGEAAYGVVPELFLPGDRVIGTAIVGFVQNVFGGILTNIILTAVNSAGISKVLVPFVAMNSFYVVVCFLFLPETSGRSAQEVADCFDTDVQLNSLRTVFTKVIDIVTKIRKRLHFSNRTLLFFCVLQISVVLTILQWVY